MVVSIRPATSTQDYSTTGANTMKPDTKLVEQLVEIITREVLIAMVTHEGPESAVAQALRLLEASPSLTEPPLVMRLLG